MSEQLQGRGWSLGRPAKARLPLSHPRGAVRAEKRGRRPGASREVELAAAHSLAGAGGRGRARPASRLGCGGSCRAASTPRPRGEAEAEAGAEVSKDASETNTEAPADVPLIRGPQEGRITDLGVRLVAAGGNTPERN